MKQNIEDIANIGSRSPKALTPAEREKVSAYFKSIDWTNPVERKVVADTITRRVAELVRVEDITQFYARRDDFNVGDTPEYHFEKGIKSYVHEPGTFAVRSTVIKRTLTLDTELVSVNPEMEISQLASGRYGNIASITKMCRDELAGRKNAILWNVLRTSIPSTTADGNYVSVSNTASVAVKKNFLASGLDYVDDVAKVKAIVGRRSVLGFINDGEGYSEAWKEKIDGAGGTLLTAFRGVPVIALHQYTDGWDVNRIPATDIMIVAEDTTVLAQTEDIGSLDNIDADTRMWNLHMFEKYGAAVFWPERNYRIAVT